MLWIGHPLTIYSVLASSLMVCLYLFVSLKREIAHIRKGRAEDNLKWGIDKNRYQASLESLRAALNEVTPPAETQAAPALWAPAPAAAGTPPAATALSMNVTKRSQALRRWRRGETPEQISATLEMPRAEVEILIKAFRAASNGAAGASVGR